MRVQEVKLYTFNELSEDSKQLAIRNYRNNNQETFMDFFTDDAIEQIHEAGFKGDIKLAYSFSYSQGDGLSFSCDYFDSKVLHGLFQDVLGSVFKDKTIEFLINNSEFRLKGNTGQYAFALASQIEFSSCLDYRRNIDILFLQVERRIMEIYVHLCHKLERQGYNEIEHQSSDEYISDNLISNECEFTADGLIF